MPLTKLQELELYKALETIALLIEQNAATRVAFEWKLGEHPSVTYTPVVPIEYASLEVTVGDEKNNA